MQRISSYIKKYRLNVVLILIILAQLPFMLHWIDARDFWSDESVTVNFTRISHGDNLLQSFKNFRLETTSPPLFYLLASIWIRIIPFDTAVSPSDPFFPRLISLIFTVLCMYFCGIVAKKIKGGRAAILSTLFAATSWYLIIQAGFQFRAYGLLVFLSILILYLYILRIENPQKTKYKIIYSVFILLTMYTHWFGLVIVGVLGLLDLCLFLRKKIKWRDMLGYLFSGILFLPYFLWVISRRTSRGLGLTFWIEPPTVQRALRTIDWITSRSDLIFTLFLAGVVITIVIAVLKYTSSGRSYIKANRDNKSDIYKSIIVLTDSKKAYYAIVPVAIVCFVFTGIYLYSRFMVPGSSFFTTRYFVAIVPQLLVVAAIGADWLIDVVFLNKRTQFEQTIIFIVIVCILALWLGLNAINHLNLFALGEILPHLGAIRIK